MKNKTTLITIFIAFIALGAGFGGGFAFKNYQISKTRANFMGVRTGQFREMGGATIGTILSMDDKSVTVKLTDGSTKIVIFADSTTYSNTAVAFKSDLKTGVNVTVFGIPNSDGSLTAKNIQLNPTLK